jgi:hypothetical protein
MNRDNLDYVDRRRDFVDGSALQFALREVQGLLKRPAFWIGLAAAIAILVVTGPSGTLGHFTAPERLAYWGSTAFVTFVTGLFATIFLARLIRPRIGARLPAIALGAVLAAIPITAEVWLVDLVFSGSPARTLAGIGSLYGICVVIAVSVSTIYDLSSPKSGEDASPATRQSPDEVPFLKRLPAHLGKELIALQAQDHYLEVTTARGKDLILMRLSDAEEELANYPGKRIHRSWWVARSAVAGIDTTGDRMSVRLSNDVIVPVSRGKRPAVRKWLTGRDGA